MRTSVVLVALLALAPAVATAQSPAGLEKAKPLAEEGIELYHEGRAAEALDALLEAEAAFSAPVHQVYIARAHARLGHLVEARRHYRMVLLDEPRSGESAGLSSIRSAAERESEALGRRIPTLTVTIAGGSRQGMRATIDGRAFRVSELERGIGLDPGEHTVEVVDGDGRTRRQRVALVERRGEQVEITLDSSDELPAALDAPPAPAMRPDSSGDSSSPEPSPPSRVPAVIAFGVGVLGLGVGAVTGIMTLSEASAIQSACRDGHCPRRDAARGENAEMLAAVSTVGFAVGAVGAVTGVVLLSLTPSTETAGVSRVRVVLRPGSVAASATF